MAIRINPIGPKGTKQCRPNVCRLYISKLYKLDKDDDEDEEIIFYSQKKNGNPFFQTLFEIILNINIDIFVIECLPASEFG